MVAPHSENLKNDKQSSVMLHIKYISGNTLLSDCFLMVFSSAIVWFFFNLCTIIICYRNQTFPRQVTIRTECINSLPLNYRHLPNKDLLLSLSKRQGLNIKPRFKVMKLSAILGKTAKFSKFQKMAFNPTNGLSQLNFQKGNPLNLLTVSTSRISTW